MRDVKDAGKTTRPKAPSGSEGLPDNVNAELEELIPRAKEDAASSKESDGGGEELTSSHQTIINLLGVDAQRVSDFCSWNNLLSGTVSCEPDWVD